MTFLKILDAGGNKIPVQAVSGTFEAASYSRRLGNWGLSSLGPDASLFSSLTTLRSRSRELVRNDPEASGGLDTLVSNLVGAGITPRWQIDDPDLKKKLQELWADWVTEADADSVADFYGQQAIACRSLIEAGEVLIRFRPRRLSDGLSVPLQLQVIEPDHLDESYSTIAESGNKIRMGIEFNSIGQRVAYWLFREHPGEYFLGADNASRVRVPASEILHIYRPLRPGQKRGRPWIASVVITMHEMSKYLDAEQVRKQAAAMYGGFLIAPPGGPDDMPGMLGGGASNEEEPDIIALEPGTFPKLPPGFDVKFSTPSEVGNSYEPFVKHQERRAARGFGCLTYEKLTGDLAEVNYSSIRAGNLEFQRFCKQVIQTVLVFQLCRPVVSYWLNQAVTSRAISIPDFLTNKKKYYRVQWCIDGWDWVDPEKDIKSERAAIRAGLKSRAESIAERGRDVESVDAEIAEDNQRADNLNIVYDSDPRHDGKVKNAK